MSLTIDTLLKSQGEVHLTEIEIHWYFTPQTDEEKLVELEGTYNIDSFYDSHITEIEHPRTLITGFYEIFNKLQFTNISTQSTFILGINYISTNELSDNQLNIEFVFHRSIPQIPFGIEKSVIAGVAEIQSSSENLLILQSLIHKNLHLHFSDHVFQIPRCTKCHSALTVHKEVDLEDEVINEDFVCMDCYTVMNNFYNLLENEVFKITDPEQMKEQRNSLVKFLITGKKSASQIEETQLQHFYNLLIIYVEYLSGNLDTVNVLQKIQAVQTIGANQNFPLLQAEAENLLNKIDLGSQENQIQEESEQKAPETWTPPDETIYSASSEPTPPPIPLGTPSPATVLPPDENLSDGLQSLQDVQAELQSTLEALSQIESDLSPRPISPTDKMHALNSELEEEELDRIPTYEDIKETFSDLESLDFPDIQFGVSSANRSESPEEIFPEEQNQQNTKVKLEFLNPPLSKNQDISKQSADEPHFQMPSIQKLPKFEQDTEDNQLSPEQESSYWDIDKEEFSGEGKFETAEDYEFNEPPTQGDDRKETYGVDEQQLQPEWRNLSETTPPVKLNPPPKLTLPQVPPPLQMNPSPAVILPETVEKPLNPVPEPEFSHVTEEPAKPILNSHSSFFNPKNGPVRKLGSKATNTAKPIQEAPKVRPKELRANKDKRNRARRIICSFCGQTVTQGNKKCPNCGSFIK